MVTSSKAPAGAAGRRASGPSSAFTRLRRLPKRGAYDPATLYAILDAATHCHVAHVVDGRPVATPTLHWRRGERLYWHGSAASRMLKTNAAGGAVCVTATLIDGFVLARSGFNHSINYRSAMCFGTPSEITEPAAKIEALQHFLEHWFPGRWATLRPPTRKELAATRVLSMPLTEASAKIREGGPHDPPADVSWPTWAGVMPLTTRVGVPVAAEDYHGTLPPPRLVGLY
ncbi:MAG TPA: pyridoxamine 5'-phosphate oxidase family protein [Steroidobacteraceae bacterium]|nr:pyridoxamine 5'-phosphate oxidase family protein [Steroidobacteraceae bacterium]